MTAQSPNFSYRGLGVVVVNYGSHELLRKNAAVMSSELLGAHIVVVDNWHSHEEREAITALSHQHGWTLLALDSNTGFGTGCNRGAEAVLAAGANALLFINPDAYIDPASVRLLLDEVQTNPMTLAAPRIFTSQGKIWSAGMSVDLATGDSRGWHRRADAPNARTIDWFTGACLMLSETLWTASGGFDDDYFLYWEDVDLSARIQAVGGTLRLLEDARAQHDVGGTQTTSSARTKSELYYYYNIRNRSLFAQKHLELADRKHWQESARQAAWAIILRGGRRQLIHSLAPWRALWRGLRDSDYGV